MSLLLSLPLKGMTVPSRGLVVKCRLLCRSTLWGLEVSLWTALSQVPGMVDLTEAQSSLFILPSLGVSSYSIFLQSLFAQLVAHLAERARRLNSQGPSQGLLHAKEASLAFPWKLRLPTLPLSAPPALTCPFATPAPSVQGIRTLQVLGTGLCKG